MIKSRIPRVVFICVCVERSMYWLCTLRYCAIPIPTFLDMGFARLHICMAQEFGKTL